jgi:hypothetical protein
VAVRRSLAGAHADWKGGRIMRDLMIADRLARALAARGVHYGWVIAALAFYVLFATSALGVPGVLILPMAQGLRLALFGLVAPFAGGLLAPLGMTNM